MSTISLRKDVKLQLQSIAGEQGLSMNKMVRLLVDDAEPTVTVECRREYANIEIDDDLLPMLKSLKRHSRESHSDVIARLIDDWNHKSNR